MQRFQMPNKAITEKHFFTFYNGKLNKIPNDIIAANIIAVLVSNNNKKRIIIYERNTKNKKSKICEVSEDEILRIKSELGVYIKPQNIKTISSLKKAIIYSVAEK